MSLISQGKGASELTKVSASRIPRSLRSRSIRLGVALNLSSAGFAGFVSTIDAFTVPIQYDNKVCRCAQPANQLALTRHEQGV
jgi:hypothetical protein